MNAFQTIILALVQGITEFLPISSSGHLVLLQKLFGIESPPVLFDVLLHFGTLLAILFFFKKEIIGLLIQWKKNLNVWIFLIVGSIPAAVFGLILNSKIEVIFSSVRLLGIMWLVFGGMLLATKFLLKNKKQNLEVKDVNWRDGLFVGLFQAFALFPGVSRSGSTMIGGLWRGFSKEAVFKMSFLLSIPAILGATVLKLSDGGAVEISLTTGILATLISAIIGYFSLKILEKIFKSNKFYRFGYYCFGIGLFSLLFSFL